MKKFLNTINNSTTFTVAHEVATSLHFSLTNVAILYGVFAIGVIAIIPGANKFTDPAQIALGHLAFELGTKED